MINDVFQRDKILAAEKNHGIFDTTIELKTPNASDNKMENGNIDEKQENLNKTEDVGDENGALLDSTTTGESEEVKGERL